MVLLRGEGIQCSKDMVETIKVIPVRQLTFSLENIPWKFLKSKISLKIHFEHWRLLICAMLSYSLGILICLLLTQKKHRSWSISFVITFGKRDYEDKYTQLFCSHVFNMRLITESIFPMLLQYLWILILS